MAFVARRRDRPSMEAAGTVEALLMGWDGAQYRAVRVDANGNLTVVVAT